jgi:hypothetical protein
MVTTVGIRVNPHKNWFGSDNGSWHVATNTCRKDIVHSLGVHDVCVYYMDMPIPDKKKNFHYISMNHFMQNKNSTRNQRILKGKPSD